MHFGLGFLYQAIFQLSYVFGSMYYDPLAAYHRWGTVATILPSIIHFVQWVWKFPENTHPRFSRGMMIVQYAIAIGILAYFIKVSSESGTKFLFAGHYYDFDADAFSRIVAAMIGLYVLSMVVVCGFKAYITKTKERWSHIQLGLIFLVGTVPPVLTNALSRDGAMSRGIHQTVVVLLLVITYFLWVIVYLNHTTDRTSFMGKIVGITLVTFLITMQGLSFYTLNDREEEYDSLHVEQTARAIEGNTRKADMEYIVMYDPKGDVIKTRFEKTAGATGPDFDAARNEFSNTYLYETARNLPESTFRADLRDLLAKSPGDFVAYRTAILAKLDTQPMDGPVTKETIVQYFDALNRMSVINLNQINGLPNVDFRTEVTKHLNKSKPEFQAFKDVLLARMEARKDLEGISLKKELGRYLMPFRAASTRIYRQSSDKHSHYVAFTYFTPGAGQVHEVGFNYVVYRGYMHEAALKQKIILAVVVSIVIGLFPLFFRGSLLNPLNSLLRGVTKVNNGDLTVKVPVKVHDEIGFLAESFNAMVTSIADAQEKLQDYANNLEEKVKERTRELNQTLDQVRALKVQQDGDYFLTSLLQKPLNYNANKSKLVSTNFIIKQKKTFEFRNKHADLGGDICVTGNLRIGKPENYKRHIVAFNGDAMGKSMQGAGGSLVMGVIMNTILARSAKNNRVMDTTPEQWLSDVYEEVHGVFMAFNGSMVISGTMVMINEETGETWYFNAEHPYMVILRNGKASFIEEELQLRKMGLESEIPFRVHKFQLEPGDVIIMGSDGRDDIDLTPDQDVRTINEDEFVFLKRVEQSRGDLEGILESLLASGAITDDLSLMRIGFQENVVARRPVEEVHAERVIIDIDIEPEPHREDKIEEAFEDLFNRGRKLARAGRHEDALEVLRQAYSLRRDYPALNKILAVLTFKDRDYSHAVEILDTYLHHDPNVADFWLYLSIAHKRLGNFDKALDAALRVHELRPDRLPNLINLGDLYQKIGDFAEARKYIDRALQIDPTNRQAQSLLAAIA